jgi:hypothetical protein
MLLILSINPVKLKKKFAGHTNTITEGVFTVSEDVTVRITAMPLRP